MHIALLCPDLTGHLNPLTTLGRELVHRGHCVTLVGNPDAKRFADRTGLGFAAIGVREHEDGVLKADQATLGTLKGFAALKFTGKMLQRAAAIMLRDAPDVLKQNGVEAVLADQVSPAASTVAEALKLPFVIVCNALAMHMHASVPPAVTTWPYRTGPLARLRNTLGNALLGIAGKPVFDQLKDFRRRHGLPIYRLGENQRSGVAQVAQQPAFFDFPRADLPEHFHYTGPWHEPGRDDHVEFPWNWLDGRPLIYASLGTLQNRLQHIFAAILHACAELPVQVVLSLGRPEAKWNGPIPANALIRPYVPQLNLLPKCTLAISHAGLNTALECLAHGLPLLAIPFANDQPGVARRLQWLGVGELIAPGKVTAMRLRPMLERLLNDSRYREAARTCQRKLSEINGVHTATDIIERALQSGYDGSHSNSFRNESCAVSS